MTQEEQEEKVPEINSPAAPGGVSGMSRRAQFTILFIIAAVIVGVWLTGPFRAAKDQTSTGKAAPAEAAGFKLTPQQWASMRTATVKEMVFQPERQAEGKIAADEYRTTSVFPPYSGRVTAVFVDEGDRVEQGRPLFRMDSTDLVQAQNDVVAGTAVVAKAQSQVNLTQTTEQRAHQLFLAKGGALKDWQQAQADLAAAQNDEKSAEIALAAAQARLRIILVQSGDTAAPASVPARTSPGLTDDLTVPAPISGTVLLRKLGIGQYLSQGATDPVLVIGDLSRVWLTANVRETDAPFVRVGQPVDVRVTAYPDKVFKAKITFVAASVDSNTHRLPIRAEVANEEGLLKPEMWADFRIATGAGRKGLAVPAQAIVYEGEAARVWVADNDHTLTSHDIEIGITNGKNVEALSGVSAGDQVITQGSIFIDRAAGND